MKALITGASSGIGKDIALYLSSLGYDLIVVARRKERLEELKKECNTNVKIITLDLSEVDNCYKLYELTMVRFLTVYLTVLTPRPVTSSGTRTLSTR